MSSPRRRGFLGLAALLLISACGDGDESLDPQLRAPATGSYAYDALVYTADGEPPDTFSGFLDIDVSSEDSIIGSWNVDGYDDPARGIWNINAYTVVTAPQPPLHGTITHRLWRQNGSGDLSCNLTYVLEMPADTFMSTSENSCSLDRE